MTRNELKDGLKNNNHNGFEEWFLEEGNKLDITEGNKVFFKKLKRIDASNLRSEVIESTIINCVRGFEFEDSIVLAMDDSSL